MDKTRYQLRRAAGMYWLIDMEQEGVPFRKPLAMNQVGADIWRMLRDGEEGGIAAALCREYRVDAEEAARDVEEFRRTLRERGISI